MTGATIEFYGIYIFGETQATYLAKSKAFDRVSHKAMVFKFSSFESNSMLIVGIDHFWPEILIQVVLMLVFFKVRASRLLYLLYIIIYTFSVTFIKMFRFIFIGVEFKGMGVKRSPRTTLMGTRVSNWVCSKVS